MNNRPNRVVYSTSTTEANMRKTGKKGMLAVANAKNRTVQCVCGATYPANKSDEHVEVCPINTDPDYFVVEPQETPVSDTHSEYVSDGYSVRVQHCEYHDPQTGQVCNKYLGVNFPSDFCGEHRGL